MRRTLKSGEIPVDASDSGLDAVHNTDPLGWEASMKPRPLLAAAISDVAMELPLRRRSIARRLLPQIAAL